MPESAVEKSGTMDVALVLAKAAVSAGASAVGLGPVAELFDLLRVPAAKRQAALLADLAERLKTLEGEHRLQLTDVLESEAFVSAAVRALEVARRTGEADKRAALRNAVLNVALRRAPDEALTQFFLDWIDRFTAWHIQVLEAFNDPVAWASAHGVRYQPAISSSLAGFLEEAFPELKQRPDLCGLVWADLNEARLLSGSLNTMMTDSGWRASRTTDLGKAFLALIQEPH